MTDWYRVVLNINWNVFLLAGSILALAIAK